MQISTDVDLMQLARDLPGLVGADLANIVNEAQLNAVRAGREELNARDMYAGVDRFTQVWRVWGMPGVVCRVRCCMEGVRSVEVWCRGCGVGVQLGGAGVQGVVWRGGCVGTGISCRLVVGRCCVEVGAVVRGWGTQSVLGEHGHGHTCRLRLCPLAW